MKIKLYTMEDYQERMAKEYKELNRKIKKLESLIKDNKTYSTLDYKKQVLMSWQLSAMKSYREALYERCLCENFIP